MRECVQELWCKKMPPTAQLLSVYRMQPLPPGGLAPPPPRGPEAADVALLTRHADAIGKLLQYRHQGFLPNARQQRMAGLAVIEMAQSLQHLVRCSCQNACGTCAAALQPEAAV